MASDNKFIRLQAVLQKTGLSRTGLYSAMKQGTFPSGIKISTRAVAWSAISVDQWIEGQITASRKGAA